MYRPDLKLINNFVFPETRFACCSVILSQSLTRAPNLTSRNTLFADTFVDAFGETCGPKSRSPASSRVDCGSITEFNSAALNFFDPTPHGRASVAGQAAPAFVRMILSILCLPTPLCLSGVQEGCLPIRKPYGSCSGRHDHPPACRPNEQCR